MKKRVAILGAGYISKYHCDAIKLIPDVKAVAICDLNLFRAQKLADSQGIKRIYKDLDEMLASEKLDCVHVLTTPVNHYPIARHILEAGVSVFSEKPLCISSKDCNNLMAIAKGKQLMLGVSHNFLCAYPYQRLLNDLDLQRLGRLDQIDIVWQKSLPQIKNMEFTSWPFSSPKDILFEVASHSFAHSVHLAGDLDQLEVKYSDPVRLFDNRLFYTRWDISGSIGKIHVRLLLSFIDAYTQHYIDVRGKNGSAHVDFVRNTYTLQRHRHSDLDFDNFSNSILAGRNLITQACMTLFNFVIAKGGFKRAAGPFADSIYKALAIFYGSNWPNRDLRLSADLGTRSVRLAERVAAHLPENTNKSEPDNEPVKQKPCGKKPKILVTGGTGFIGKALVTRLLEIGLGVRVMTRSPERHQIYFKQAGVEVVKGDMLDFLSVEAALEDIDFVYHLARGEGPNWLDYITSECEPTRKLAEACLIRAIELIYTSSIIVHATNRGNHPIIDQTPPHSGRTRTNNYARSKAESERLLQKLYHQEGLKLVVVRPGIVIGPRCTPLHAGIGSFPHSTSVCSIIGAGQSILPLVLIDDCVDAMARVVEAELAGANLTGSCFNIVGDPYLNACQYIDELESYTGCKIARIFNSPRRIFLQEIFKWVIKKIGRNSDNGFPSLASIKGYAYLAPYDNSFIKEKLGWHPTKDRQKIIDKGIRIPAKQFIDCDAS